MSKSDLNAQSVAGYEACAEEYASTTGPDQVALGELIKVLDASAQVLEIGSGPGWDADWMEARGIRVRRTDAAHSFVELQKARGKQAEQLDVLRDELGGPYDAVVAMYVLQHIDRAALPEVFRKAAGALREGGLFLFSIREGQGEQVTRGETGASYYVAQWELKELVSILIPLGINVVWSDSFQGSEGRWMRVLGGMGPR